jgi:hypothetical protein
MQHFFSVALCLLMAAVSNAQTGNTAAIQPPPSKVVKVSGVGKDMAYKQDKTEAQVKATAVSEAQNAAKDTCRVAATGAVTYSLQSCTSSNKSSTFFVKDEAAIKAMNEFGYFVTNSSNFHIANSTYNCDCAIYNYAPPPQ